MSALLLFVSSTTPQLAGNEVTARYSIVVTFVAINAYRTVT